MLKKACTVLTVAGVIGSTFVALAPVASADPQIAGTYNTVRPVRVLNTLIGRGAPKAALAAGQSLTFTVASALPSPLVSAEALNIEAYQPARSGYLVVYPTGTPEPKTSTLNFAAGSVTSNLAYVGYGTGSVTIHNVSTGTVNLVADLSGYWTGGSVDSSIAGAYNSLPSTRLLDSRSSDPTPASGDLAVPVLGQGGVPDAGVSAVAVNVTVPLPAASGYLTATANPTDQLGTSRTSDVSFIAGQSRAGLVVVPVDPDTGAISLFNGSSKPQGVVVDVLGYFNDGPQTEAGAFVSTTPFRNSDTRSSGPIGPGKTMTFRFVEAGSPQVFEAVVATLTAAGPPGRGYLTAWSGVGSRPPTSDLAFAAGQSAADETVTALNPNGTISVYNGSTSPVNIVIDVHGYMLNDLPGEQNVTQRQIRSALTHARSAAATRIAS